MVDQFFLTYLGPATSFLVLMTLVFLVVFRALFKITR